METGLPKVTLCVSLLKVASCVSSVSQLIRVTFVSGLVPNTASKLNGFVPIPCFSIFTFTFVMSKSGPFAGALNKPSLLVWTCAFLGATSLALSFLFSEINSLSTFCTESIGASSPAANAGLIVPNIITIASRKESNLEFTLLFKSKPPFYFISYYLTLIVRVAD